MDGHVHLYPNFSLESAFDSAWRNFSEVATSDSANNPIYVMMLVDSGHLKVFEDIKSGQRQADLGRWSVLPTKENNSIQLHHPDKGSLLLICGKQWVSKEDLEVLCYFTNKTINSRDMTLAELLAAIRDQGGLPLLTWGVGKWTGSRGEIIEQAIRTEQNSTLVGDNGNRPAFWSFPSQLDLATQSGWTMISGSDPLTLKPHQHRIGTMGSYLEAVQFDPDYPATSLQDLILKQQAKFEPFGSLRPWYHFFGEQVRMQINKQLRRFKR